MFLQTFVDKLKISVGQDEEVPEHFSVMSQIPVEALHKFPVEFESIGQAEEEFVQYSAAPHAPTEALQIFVD